MARLLVVLRLPEEATEEIDEEAEASTVVLLALTCDVVMREEVESCEVEGEEDEPILGLSVE